MKIKTSELSGVALDWAVAKAAGQKIYEVNGFLRTDIDGEVVDLIIGEGGFSPSQDWSQGGPLIERFGIAIIRRDAHEWVASESWYEPYESTGFDGSGPSALIAAMRAIVANKPGDKVDVPEGLIDAI